MATQASRAQAQQWNLNENVKGEMKGLAGKGTNAPRPGAGRRALAEVGNLVEASTQIAGPGKFKEVASKTGVVTRNAARRAGGDVAPQSTTTTTATAAPTVAPAPAGAKPPAKAKKVKVVGCKVAADPEASKSQEESETSPEVAEVSAATFADAAAAKKAAAANHLAVASSCAVAEEAASAQDTSATEGDGSSIVTAISGQISQTEERLSTSAMLAACSEEACGGFTDSLMTEAIAAGPDEEEVDIDWEDHANPLAVTQYVEDIYTFYRKAETQSVVPEDYMSRQADINEKMRGILLDWLIEVHLKFKLMPETLYLTANLIDRYLAITQVQRRNLQLVGVTAMLIASKYEEIWAPEVRDFVYISDNAYTKDHILSMEKHMLNSLGFNLTVPTPYVFAARFMKAMWVAAAKEGSSLVNPDVKRVIEMVVWYLLELTLPEYAMLRFPPSMLAASAVYTALLMEHRCSPRGSTRAGATGRVDSSSTTPTGSTASSNIFATGSSVGHRGRIVGDGQEDFTRSTSTNSTCSSSIISEGNGDKNAALGSALHLPMNDVKEEARVGNDPVWYAVLLRHTGYTPEELRPCAALMALFQQRAGTGSLHAVHKKYQSSKFASVARLPLCTLSVDVGVHPLLLAVLPQVAATGGAAGALAAGALAASAARSGSTVSTTR